MWRMNRACIISLSLIPVSDKIKKVRRLGYFLYKKIVETGIIMKQKIAVVGAGAAGMMAAIQAALSGACVDLFEKNDRVGKKLLMTGNGKCNFSNLDLNKEAYYGSGVSFCDNFFKLFGVKETVAFFARYGMLSKDRNGYLYPMSGQASTVLDILRILLNRTNVNIHTGAGIQAIYRDETINKLKIKDESGQEQSYDSVILACGGKAAPSTGSDGSGFDLAKSLGHHITRTVPALVQLYCQESFFKSVAGVRADAMLTLKIDDKARQSVSGELQLTDRGISGIPVFQFSREAAYALMDRHKVTVEINFLPTLDDEAFRDMFKNRWENHYKLRRFGGNPAEEITCCETIEEFLTGIVNKKLNQLIIRLAGCKYTDSVTELSKEKRAEIERLYRHFTVQVVSTGGFQKAQVTAGGIPAKELTLNLESIYVPGIYLAGEMIDIDGICGGYNLQWAWTSGTIAGLAAAGNPLINLQRGMLRNGGKYDKNKSD